MSATPPNPESPPDNDAGELPEEVLEALSEHVPTDSSEAGAGTYISEGDPQTLESGAVAATGEDSGSQPAPGSVLRGRFLLEKRIGGGTMGHIFKALDQRRHEAGQPEPWVAIKLMRSDARQARAALQQEALLAQRLSHPNIARVFDLDRDGEHSFLTMEWLDGESLASFLDQRRFRPLARHHALQIIEGVCRALAFAHGQGVVHADVKPGNIFLLPDGGVKLLDFGVARVVEESSQPGAARGHTPEYASLEVLEGQTPEAADDLYSVACVAYRMLAGKRVFGRENARNALANGIVPEPIAHLPSHQWQALERALAFRREDRYPDVNSFIAALKGPRQEHVPAEEPDELELDTIFGPERSRFIAMVAALAVIAAVAVWALLPGGNPPPAGANSLANAPAATAEAAPEPAIAPEPVEVNLFADEFTPAEEPAPEPPAEPDPVAADQFANELAAAAEAAPEPPAEAEPVATNLFASEFTPAQVPAPEPPTETRAVEPEPFTSESAPAPEPASELPFVAFAELRLRRYAEPRRLDTGADTRGFVDIGFEVDRSGFARNIRILRADPPGPQAQAAAAALGRWQFQPVARGGEVIEVQSEVRLNFAPDGPAAASN